MRKIHFQGFFQDFGSFSNKSKLKYLFSLMIVVVGILSILGGTSYAILKGNISASNEHVIKTGSVKIKLTENTEGISKRIKIMEDSDGLLQEETYDFNIKNIGDAPAKFDLKLVNDVPSDYTGKVLNTKYIKVGLEINGEEYGPMSLENVKNIIDSDIIFEKEMIKYKLRIWLDKSKEEVLNMEDYTAFLKLKVEAEQRVKDMDISDRTTVFNYTGDVQKYMVPRDGYYYIEMAGAEGGSAKYTTSYSGGKGGLSSGYIYLESGDMLYFNVGGMGTSHSGTTTDTPKANGNGYNGGSTGMFASGNSNAGGGGGATDVRVYENDIKPNKKFRYVRNHINGSSANTANHWVEVKVYDESGNNISQRKTATYNGKLNTTHTDVSMVTDGDIATANYFELSSASEDAYVEIDLGSEYEISKVEVWHYFGDGRIYYNNKTELLNKDKSEVQVVYNSTVNGTYVENSDGKVITNDLFTKDLASRIMVAGGGGGADSHTSAPSYSGYGGNGGTLHGQDAQKINNNCYTFGEGGYQSSGGSSIACSSSYTTKVSGEFGIGGSDLHSGGGGGYYGGASGYHTSAGGGSSYISGYAGVNSVKKSTTITHTNQTLHYSGKYFIGGKITEGQNEGNGYAKITYVDVKPKRRNSELNNVRYIKNCVNNDSSNSINNWTEIEAIKDGINIAKGKSGNIYDSSGNIVQILGANYETSYVTDGMIDNVEGSKGYSTGVTHTGLQCFVVDLETIYDLDEIAVWHYANDMRVYYDDITYVSNDNKNWTKIMNETKSEDHNGRRINAYVDNYNGYVQDNLVLWYDGYANTGTTRNFSTTTWKNLASSSYTGTISGAAWNRNYLSFDGVNDWVRIAQMNYPTPTLEVVFSYVYSGAPAQVLSNLQSGGNNIYLSSDGGRVKSLYHIGGDYRTVSEYTSVGSNVISTYSSSFDKTKVKFYKKGNLESTLNYPGAIGYPINSTVMAVGTNPNGTSSDIEYLNGNIYSVRIYDRALTDEEVFHNYLYDKQKFNLE